LKRVFARTFSEILLRFTTRVETECGNRITEYAKKFRIDLLFFYQNMLVGDGLVGLRNQFNTLVLGMIDVVERKLPLVDKEDPAGDAVIKLKTLIDESKGAGA
jgi:hypothetical protein